MRLTHPAPLAPLALAAVAALAGCGSTSSSSPPATSRAAACVPGAASASGSTALQPLVQAAAQAYRATCPGATITVSGGGSSVGLSSVAEGTADIGDSDVPVSNAKNIDPSTVTDHQVAIVLFGVAVNRQTGVTGLSRSQIADVFGGRVTNWSQVGGANLPVTLIERKPGSGTRISFDKILMKGTPESATPASTQDSTQLVLQQVTASPGAVSYLGVSSIPKGSPVMPVTIDGIEPSAASVSAGSYPFYSHEHMYIKAGASGLPLSFINFILSEPFQRGDVTRLGYLPVSTTTRQSAAD